MSKAEDESSPTQSRKASDNEQYDVMLVIPETEARAFAKLVASIDYDTCNRFASVCYTYGTRSEGDVMWSALCMIQRQLSEAGFAPR
jgi:hypothetical protein